MTFVRCVRCRLIYRTTVPWSLIATINRSKCCGEPLKHDEVADLVGAQTRAGEVPAG